MRKVSQIETDPRGSLGRYRRVCLNRKKCDCIPELTYRIPTRVRNEKVCPAAYLYVRNPMRHVGPMDFRETF